MIVTIINLFILVLIVRAIFSWFPGMLYTQAGRYVLVVDQEKKVELRRVTTGVEQGRDVVVTDGLKEGELVIVEGIQKVRPGQVVAVSTVPGN